MNDILLKIQKLFALSRSPNEYEAALALAKAHELMIQHSIEMSEVQSFESSNSWADTSTDFSFRYRSAWPAWSFGIVDIVQEYFSVQAYYQFEVDPVNGSSYRRLRLFGKQHHVAVAIHVLNYLSQTAARLFRFHDQQGRFNHLSRTQAVRSYYLGFAQGISHRLSRDMSVHRSLNGKGLSIVAADKCDLSRAFHDRFGKMKSASRPKNQQDGDAVLAGIRDGKETTIHTVIAPEPIDQNRIGSN